MTKRYGSQYDEITLQSCDNQVTLNCPNAGTVEMHGFWFCDSCADQYVINVAKRRGESQRAIAATRAYQREQTVARRKQRS